MDPDPSSLHLLISIADNFTIIKLALLLLLLCCSAMISGAEVAFFSLSVTTIKELEDKETPVNNLIVKLLDNPRRLLATILVSNNFINIAIVLLFASLEALFFSWIDIGWVKLTVQIGVVTFLILMFGEILPKIYANRNALSFASFMARPINFLGYLFSPLSFPMASVTEFLNKRFGKQKSNLSVDQLSQALELTSEDETTTEEQKILKGIVSFGNTDTRQVMRPRIDIFALNETTPFSDVLEEIKNKGYSRVPIYSENMDNITGVLYVKDLLPYLDNSIFDWVSLKREPLFVPENKKLDDLLKEFQEKKNHIAVVVDEYGGTSGIVTLEDVIEEIVGDLSNEFDDEDLIYSKLDDYNYVFEGKTALKDLYRVIKIDDDSLFEAQKGESETIAGLVLEIAGSFPKRGAKIAFHDYTFVVESLDRKRIKQVKITLPHDKE